MKKAVKLFFTTLVVVASAIVILSLIGFLFLVLSFGDGTITETRSPTDYGTIEGNFDNDAPREFIFSFFRRKLNPTFPT